jgi:hypothetical protein
MHASPKKGALPLGFASPRSISAKMKPIPVFILAKILPPEAQLSTSVPAKRTKP